MEYRDIIIKGCFEEFDKIIDSEKELDNIHCAAVRLGMNEENIMSYYACVYMTNADILDREKAKFHDAASTILTIGLTYVTGAYALGYYHIKKAMELDPDNIDYKQTALTCFAEIPDYDMDKSEIVKIAEEILEMDSNDPIGMKYYNKYNLQ
ncbi:MAG: hypothetical protein IKL57_00405 [Oscillospiraceae bacterium]|nr:hypothetical protein [Oscillospiraceae bacterium]